MIDFSKPTATPSLKATLRALDVSHAVRVSADDFKRGTIQGYAYDLKSAEGLEFTTHFDKETRQFIITRIA